MGCLAQINEILNSDTGCTARQRLRALTSDERQPGAICIIVKKKQYFRCRIESLTLDQVLVGIYRLMCLYCKFAIIFLFLNFRFMLLILGRSFGGNYWRVK